MKKTLLVIAGLLIAVMFVPHASAQDDLLKGRWWTMERVVQRLGLTSAQVDEIDQIAATSQEKMIDIRAEMSKAKLAMQRLLDAETIDDDAIDAAITRTVSAQCAMTEANHRYRLEIAKVLSRSQRVQLMNLNKARERRRSMRGAGK